MINNYLNGGFTPKKMAELIFKDLLENGKWVTPDVTNVAEAAKTLAMLSAHENIDKNEKLSISFHAEAKYWQAVKDEIEKL